MSQPPDDTPGSGAPGPAGPRRQSFDSLAPGPKAGRDCVACNRTLEAGEAFTAVLIELARNAPGGEPEFQRLDYCGDCWPESPWADPQTPLDEGQSAHPADTYGAEPVAAWSGRVAPSEKKKRPFVDDRVLTQFFLRLADDEDPAEPSRQRFRFVLMLVLMRHRKLRHAGTERTDEGDVWKVRLTPAMAEATHSSADEIHRVLDPRLGEAGIADVAAQLRQILQEDFDEPDESGPGDPS
jgi:hypothetical protein